MRMNSFEVALQWVTYLLLELAYSPDLIVEKTIYTFVPCIKICGKWYSRYVDDMKSESILQYRHGWRGALGVEQMFANKK